MHESLRYLASRLITAVLIVLGAMTLLITLSSIVPGDPAATLGPQATPEASKRFIEEMGLDQPIPVRIGQFFMQVLNGNLGSDIISGRSVTSMISEVLPYTLTLTFVAIGIAVMTGVPMGIFAATHRGSIMDNVMAIILAPVKVEDST